VLKGVGDRIKNINGILKALRVTWPLKGQPSRRRNDERPSDKTMEV